ncbi:tetratricopeptide repeat protein [Polaribacter haliotis]|uniref:Tetratricopeptide repeat protein n=1 Tax=Polaribacter haliotis TaxID=1888915 RepID=A0A7L8ACR5_9FLAO|nr:tetratricopeptide repeat protein [Polaribacter haliotis]QOD59724.1 tetratricopeptide repeat protein [Polaribacter haliotis]
MAKLTEMTKYYRRGNPVVHLHFIKKALKHSEKINDKEKNAVAIRELAVYYTKTNQLDSAMQQSKKAMRAFEEIDHKMGICISKSSMAAIYQMRGDYVNAIKYYNDVASFLETQGDQKKMQALQIKSNIAVLYSKMDNSEKADFYWESIYNDSLAKKNKTLLGDISLNLSISKWKQGDFNKSILYGLDAEKLNKRPRSLAKIYLSLGTAYSKNKNYKESFKYFNKSLEIRKQLNDSLGIQETYQNIAYSLKDQGRLKDAEKYFLSSNNFIEKSGDIATLQKSYQGLSELYQESNNFKKSLEYYKKEMVLKDSLIGIEKLKTFSDLEVKYETEKTKREKEVAEKQVAITQLESQKNRNLFLGSLIIGGLILLASLFYFSRLKAKKRAELISIELKETQKRLAIEKQYKDSELKALKAQMNPHFIFNALNSIQEYIVLNQKNLASDYLAKFADLIRNYLHFSDTGYITIPEEVHNLNLYLELEKLRFEEQLTYTFQVDEKANSETIKIPTMLIQPYVENALKHGLLHKKENRVLTISISKYSDKIIECIIEDNGIGREKSKSINQKREQQHKSFALKATTERLDLLNYGREKKIGVTILDLKENNTATGTKVILKIPILT